MLTLLELLQGLAAWPVALALSRSAIAYPLVNAAHILALPLLFGSIAVLDLRLLGLFRGSPMGAVAGPSLRVAVGGFVLAAATGFLLFSTRPFTYVENSAFLLKLGLIGLALLNVAVVHANPGWQVALTGGAVHGSLRASAAISLLLWVAVVLAGRWIGFLQ
jgi:hypothetical protein